MDNANTIFNPTINGYNELLKSNFYVDKTELISSGWMAEFIGFTNTEVKMLRKKQKKEIKQQKMLIQTQTQKPKTVANDSIDNSKNNSNKRKKFNDSKDSSYKKQKKNNEEVRNIKQNENYNKVHYNEKDKKEKDKMKEKNKIDKKEKKDKKYQKDKKKGKI